MSKEPLQVLVVEDSPQDADLTVHQLKRAGYDFTWQRVATEGEYVAALDPHLDLILADYNLPQFNALRALCLLQEKGLDIPFIVVTGSIEEVAIECMQQGAADYLLKDRLGRLGQAVERALAEKRLRDDKRRAEKLLHESQRALATLMSNLPGMAYRGVYYPVWMMKFVSDGCLALTGYQKDELENRRVRYENLVHPEDLARVRSEIETALKAERPYQITYRIITATGALRWVWEQGSGIYSDERDTPESETARVRLLDGVDPSATAIFNIADVLRKAKQSPAPKSLQAIEGFITDITSRIQAEESLRNSEEMFRQLAESVHDIFWVQEAATGKLIYISPVYDTISGRSRWPLYDSAFSFLRALHPADRALIRQAVRDHASGKPVRGQPYRLLRPDGSLRWVEARTYPIYNDAQQIYRWAGVAEDITDRKLADEKLHQQAERLQVLDSVARSLSDILQDDRLALEAVARQVAAFLGDACVIALLSSNGGMLHPAALHHTNPQAEEHLRPALGQILLRHPLPQQLFYQEGPVFLPHVSPADAATWAWQDDGHYLKRYGLSSLMAVILRAQGKRIGVIATARGHKQPAYTSDDLAFLQEVANRTALTVLNSCLYTENLRRLDHLQALREIDIAISGSVDLQIALKVILEKALSQLQVDAACALTYEANLLELEYVAALGLRHALVKKNHLALNDSLAGRVILENQPISLPNIETLPDVFERFPQQAAWMHREGFVAYFARPLMAKGEVQGILEIMHRSPLTPDQEWLDFLDALGGQTAIAINNANLLTNLRHRNLELSMAYDETIQGWSRALDLRNHETEDHTQRVTEMTLRLARAMGFSGERLADIQRGALLHDIGKMGVPDEILLKPDKLTAAEWVEMRKHPLYAYNMLAPIAYLRPALDIPYCHHEWWDGNGYPRGLKGEQIPLEARIFAITDVWDAITFARAYNPRALTTTEAAELIRARSGTHFDPQVVAKFFEVFGAEFGLA